MKAIRRSPVTRVTAWLLTLAMIAPLMFVGRSARAQDQQVLKVVITDTENRAAVASATLGINATAALYNEMAASGLGKFNVISKDEIRNEATSIGLPVPSNPAAPFNWDDNQWLRVAKNLGADDLVISQVGAARLGGKTPGVHVAITVELRDVAGGILTNGGESEQNETARPGEPASTEELLNKGVSDAALNVVRSVVSHQIVSATVLNINADHVIIDRGLRDGLKVGDRIQILRDNGQGAKYPTGEVAIGQCYATDSDCKVVKDLAGIRPEDIGRVIYTPNFVIIQVLPLAQWNKPSSNPILTRNVQNHPLNMAAIGGTLAVIAVGVLLSAANKGGQISITGLTAEPTSAQASAAVLVRWRDNIFGQGNVQQYKIYREPDFPYNSVGAVSGGNGGTGGTTTTNVAFPVAVVAGVDHQYTDLPSPNFPYANGGQILIGSSNGGLGSSGAQSGGSSNGGGSNSQLATIAAPPTLDTGFTPGKTYNYQVTAIILRSIPSSGNTNGGSGGGGGIGGGGGGIGGGGGGGIGGGGGGGIGGGGGNGGNGGGGGTTGGVEYIETDPATSGNTTPVTPVQLSTPTPAAGNINARAFAPQWLSTIGADVFQVEISTDRLFKTPSLIYQSGLIVSTAPFQNGILQTLPTPGTIDLTVQPQLLASPAFAAFVAQTSGSSPSSPLIYWRVGARNDEDNPGPVNWISQNSMDTNRSFRFVYTVPIFFTAAPGPPPPPTSKAAQMLNAQFTSRGLLSLPTVGASNGRSSGKIVLTPQDILSGRRTRN